MGLDTVELVIRIEEAFDLVIPDEQAEKILTIGDAYRFILKRLEFPESPGPCLTPARSTVSGCAMMKLAGTPGAAVRPEARLDGVLADPDRRRAWDRPGRIAGMAAARAPAFGPGRDRLGNRGPRPGRGPCGLAALRAFPGQPLLLNVRCFLAAYPGLLAASFATRPLATRTRNAELSGA